jgi:fumarylacetoacetase
LNSFAALGQPVHSVVRKYIQSVFLEDTPYPEILKDKEAIQAKVLVPLKDVTNHLPMNIGDYTDFFVGRNHAYNCGVIFRGAENALHKNYNHLPVGYHGRASSVVVSGTPIRRPWGQILPQGEQKPIQSPCRRLDFELEFGAFVCKANAMGEPVLIDDAEQSIFGYVLLCDWSARDIQTWESTPLGPFNAKNFGTTISPWIVLPDALEPFAAKGLDNPETLQPYMREKKEKNVFDINFTVQIQRKRSEQGDDDKFADIETAQNGQSTTVTDTSSKYLLFSFQQMLVSQSESLL